MILKAFFFIGLIILASSVSGQLSISNPQICHDRDNYLKCYNDGTYYLNFENGNFKEIGTTDSAFKYSDTERSFTFFRKSLFDSLVVDTLQIKLLAKSVLIIEGAEKLEINSLSNISSKINEFHVSVYSINNIVRGLVVYDENKYFEIEIWTFGKSWQWNFLMKQFNQRLGVQYNGSRGNRVESVIIIDNDAKIGIAVSMTFKSLKKVSRFRSFYAPLENRTSATSTSIIPLENSYKYEYNKQGKLIKSKVVGKLQTCNCY